MTDIKHIIIWICLSTTHVKQLWQNVGWDPAACILVQDI